MAVASLMDRPDMPAISSSVEGRLAIRERIVSEVTLKGFRSVWFYA